MPSTASPLAPPSHSSPNKQTSRRECPHQAPRAKRTEDAAQPRALATTAASSRRSRRRIGLCRKTAPGPARPRRGRPVPPRTGMPGTRVPGSIPALGRDRPAAAAAPGAARGGRRRSVMEAANAHASRCAARHREAGKVRLVRSSGAEQPPVVRQRGFSPHAPSSVQHRKRPQPGDRARRTPCRSSERSRTSSTPRSSRCGNFGRLSARVVEAKGDSAPGSSADRPRWRNASTFAPAPWEAE